MFKTSYEKVHVIHENSGSLLRAVEGLQGLITKDYHCNKSVYQNWFYPLAKQNN